MYDQKTYGENQLDALNRIAEALACEDENLREAERDKRWLYIAGKPGSGKSEVTKEGAIRAAKKGFSVFRGIYYNPHGTRYASECIDDLQFLLVFYGALGHLGHTIHGNDKAGAQINSLGLIGMSNRATRAFLQVAAP